LPSDWAEDHCSCQPWLDGVYGTWKLVSGRGACLLELGRQLVKVEGVTEVSYNSRVYTLLAEIYSVTALNRL
jgi:hypothetical protein